MPQVVNAIARLVGQTVNVAYNASTGWGSRPAQITLTMPAGQLRAVQGQVTDLTITDASQQLLWVDCRIASIATAEPVSSGLVQVTLEDRRWRWEFGAIDGDYNVEKPDKTLKREKSPQELASLLAEAMRETTLDASALPNTPRPRKAWRNASPRDELDQLCAEYGCVVSFDGPQNRATIVRIGQGAPVYYDGQGQISRSDGKTLPAWPSQIRVATGTALFQSQLLCNLAVGLETDGSIKPIDELSYAPAGGWASSFFNTPESFVNLPQSYQRDGQTLYVRDLAIQSVFRWYRIAGQAFGDPFSPAALVGSDYQPSSLDDLGPFLDTRLERDPATGNRVPPVVIGNFYDGTEAYRNVVNVVYRGSYRINNETKCVEFDEPVYFLMDPNGTGPPYAPANLSIVVGYAASKNGVPVRYERFRDNSGQDYGAGPRVEVHDELTPEIIEATAFAGLPTDNLAEVTAEAEFYLDAVAAQYQPTDSTQVELPGTVYVEPDGKLRQIQWQGGAGSPSTTRLAYNQEINAFVPDFRDTPEARAKRVAEQAARQREAKVQGKLRLPAGVR